MKRNTLPGNYQGFAEKKYASYQVTSQYVSGYDGTKLAVDVIRPLNEENKPAEEKLPTLLLISRGGRFKGASDSTGSDIIDFCVPYGYVGVVAEMRGCGASYGTNDSFCSIENRQDVTCILNWIGQQPWSDGTAATFGGSNRGLGQFTASVAKPAPSPVLKAITPVVANADFYYQDYPNGVSALSRRHQLSGSRQSDRKLSKEEFLETVKPVDEDPSGDMAYEAYETGHYGKNHGFMGYLLLEDMCRDDPNPNFGGERTNLTIPPITDIEVFKKADIKIHQFAGFIESGAFGQLMATKEWGGSILIGPWDHRESRRGTKGFPEGMFDFKSEHLKWFDAVLKGKDNGFFEKPPFMYYTQHAGAGRYWRCSDTWPLETVRPMTLYLSGGQNGSLSQTCPAEEGAAEYQVDLSVQAFDNGEGGTLDRMHLTWDGDMTEGVDKKGLTFTSAPLFRMYENEITGETPVELWVSSTHPDGDFILYLEEVLADGTSHYVTMGCQRASHRTSAPRKAWNECGATYHPSMREDVEACLKEGMEQPVKLQFHLEPVSYVFQKGSRIRVTVVCATEQCFQHNLYDPKDLPVIRLYQGGAHASFIRLPFVEHTENVYNGTVTMGGYQGPGTLYFFDKHTYLYCDGKWHRYDSDSADMKYTVANGTASFGAGFTFVQEGLPVLDGILQDYQGGKKAEVPFPTKRSLLVDRVPVSAREDFLFAPGEKSLYMNVFRATDEETPAPCVVYIHGYSATPSMLRPQIVELINRGYTVIGIDLRNYPPNGFPDYVYDLKGNIRYIRAHAGELGIDPDRIGCYGQSLGGNSALCLAALGGEPELEGTVGGNEGVSSRIQAAVVGYGWSDLLYMGQDLMEEYAHAPEHIREMKFKNSDGPYAPLSQVIGFSGEGKGIKVLRDYLESGKEGTDVYMDEMLRKARQASPVNHIGPDCAPLALYGGVGMTRVDIPNKQSLRTFEVCGRYGVDCCYFANTNGHYGEKPEIYAGILEFLDKHLKNGPAVKKMVAVPGSCRIVEDYRDRKLDYAPVICTEQGELLLSLRYLKEYFDLELPEAVQAGDEAYVRPEQLKETQADCMFFPDKNMAVIAWKCALPERNAKNREGR